MPVEVGDAEVRAGIAEMREAARRRSRSAPSSCRGARALARSRSEACAVGERSSHAASSSSRSAQQRAQLARRSSPQPRLVVGRPRRPSRSCSSRLARAEALLQRALKPGDLLARRRAAPRPSRRRSRAARRRRRRRRSDGGRRIRRLGRVRAAARYCSMPPGRWRIPPSSVERVHVVAHALDEVAVVADDHQRAGPAVEQILQRGERVDVQVVGRLVEQQDVRARP